MTKRELTELLEGVRAGTVRTEDAVRRLRAAPFEDLGFAKIDRHRQLRQGAAEVVYGEGKTAEQVCAIVRRLRADGTGPVLVTRLDADKAAALRAAEPDAVWDARSRLAVVGPVPEPDGVGTICVCTAGTSDQPVAEEAARTAEALGNRVTRLYDVGVAGLERLRECIQDDHLSFSGKADVVPPELTSVGYGAAFEGLAALLAMLNSCASGVSVVNIDNGFGAGFLASRMNHM